MYGLKNKVHQTKVRRMSNEGWTNVEQRSIERRMKVRQTSDRCQTKAKRILNGHRTEVKRKLEENWMKIKWKSHENWTKIEQTSDETAERQNGVTKQIATIMNYTGRSATKWFVSASFTTMACRREERIFFLLLRVLFSF
jgi:hypothetical protein